MCIYIIYLYYMTKSLGFLANTIIHDNSDGC